MNKTAIVIVAYNRITSLKRLIGSLEKANYPEGSNITLIISIDYSGENEVEDYAKSYKWKYGEKIIRTFSENQGLKNHVLQCGDFTFDYDFIIVLEDDIYVSDSYYYYAYSAVEYYKNDDKIAGISLYSHKINWLNRNIFFEPQKKSSDVYFMRLAKSWGQVWTKNQWIPFRKWVEENPRIIWNHKLPTALRDWPESSWLKFHHKYCIENDKYFVYPYHSLSTNFTDPGTHNKFRLEEYQVSLQEATKTFKFEKFTNSSIIYDEYMERMNLGDLLGINEEELCVDLNGIKSEFLYKRYLLTTKNLGYKILKSYRLSMRPIEASVLNDVHGEDIKLYDTRYKQNVQESYVDINRYFWKISDLRTLYKYCYRLTKNYMYTRIWLKIVTMFKQK